MGPRVHPTFTFDHLHGQATAVDWGPVEHIEMVSVGHMIFALCLLCDFFLSLLNKVHFW